MESYTMTPADMRAVTDGGRDDGFGMGGGWMWIIVLGSPPHARGKDIFCFIRKLQ